MPSAKVLLAQLVNLKEIIAHENHSAGCGLEKTMVVFLASGHERRLADGR